MTARTTKKTVTFRRPFILDGLDEVQPAGVYHVETDEELLEGISFPAYRRILTLIRLHAKPGRPGITQVLTIDPKDLDAALMLDARSETKTSDGGSSRRRIGSATISRDEKDDIAAEERSEDDGMAEHPRKGLDPAKWADNRTANAVAGRR